MSEIYMNLGMLLKGEKLTDYQRSLAFSEYKKLLSFQAKLEECKKRRDRYKEAGEKILFKYKKMKDGPLLSATKENQKLREYTYHKKTCQAYYQPVKCTCGLENILNPEE